MTFTKSLYCNCQQTENYPMNGDCLKESLVCYATISWNDKNYKQKLYKSTILQTWHQAINRILEIENKATKPTDALEDKRNDKDKHLLKTLSSGMKSCDIT